MAYKLPDPGEMRIHHSSESEDGKAMMEAVLAAKAAITKFLGVECDIAIGAHPHHAKGENCSALVITPEGMPIELAAKVMWLGLGGLQMIMAEMPDQNDTVN